MASTKDNKQSKKSWYDRIFNILDHLPFSDTVYFEYFFYAIFLFIYLSVIVVFSLLIFYLWDLFKIWKAKIEGWDAVVISALIAGFFSIPHLFLSRYLEFWKQKKLYFFEKRIKTYENIVAFLFKYQEREGYTPDINLKEAQTACFSINQQVMLWGSIEIQRIWIKYLTESWQKYNNSYQRNATKLFSQIVKETGQKLKKDSLYDWPEMTLFYDKSSVSLLSSNKHVEKALI